MRLQRTLTTPTSTWLKPFYYTQWNTLPVEYFLVAAFTTDGPYNETALTRPDWDKRLNEARAALDPNTRQEMFNQLQEELWNEGGYIMWGFNNWVDAVAANVRGIEPSDVLALDGYNFHAGVVCLSRYEL